MPSPKAAEVSAVQFWKTYVPIEVTDPGTETEVRPEFLNA